MDYTKDITNHQKGKHFSLGDRRELQGILSDSSKQYSLRQLAKYFNCAPNTIRNELKRGAHPHTGRYELLVLNVPILLAIATVFASLKDFLQVILLLGLFEKYCKNTGLWMPAMAMPWTIIYFLSKKLCA